MDLFNYEITNIDLKIIDSFNTQAKVRTGGIQRFNAKNMKINGSGDEVCLTGFTNQEKMKFGELLAKKGYRVRTSVTSDLRFLVTPSGSYKGSPSKEIEAKNVGAKIVDLNSFLQTYA